MEDKLLNSEHLQ